MKRVLLVNKFYYNRGGDCVCAINLENLLKAKGHQVAVFAMQYDQNIASEYSSYFASEVSFAGGIGAKFNAAKRIFGLGDIKSQFSKILHNFKPDIVHLNNIHSYLSPVVAKMAKEFGAKVVWTLHDYKLLCPSYACLRNGKPCELCFNDKSSILKHKCMKGSTVASILAHFEAKYWSKAKLQKYTDTFICPSHFMKSRMEMGGFNRLNVVCNFVDPVKLDKFNNLNTCDRKDYYVYVGRLSTEKGINTLIEVAKTLNYPLKVVGGGPLEDLLKKSCEGIGHIQFLGHQNAENVANLLSQARFSVVPSECYENNPLSVIESRCAGTPIVGANIAGIPELIDENCGVTFSSGDKGSLKQAIEFAWNKQWEYKNIKEFAIKTFSPDEHYSKLNVIYG